jgi:hypothetical protein
MAGRQIEMYSLAELMQQLRTGLNEGGRMLFWNHQVDGIMYLTGTNQDRRGYRQELRNLRRQRRSGSVVQVAAGESIFVDGRELHTMEVTMSNIPCHPYMMLRMRGRIDDGDKTPYFFTSQDSRDRAVAWINRAEA